MNEPRIIPWRKHPKCHKCGKPNDAHYDRNSNTCTACWDAMFKRKEAKP